MAGYVYVCDDEANRDNGVELPTEEDGNLLISVLQSQFERASGLKYRLEVVSVSLANFYWVRRILPARLSERGGREDSFLGISMKWRGF